MSKLRVHSFSISIDGFGLGWIRIFRNPLSFAPSPNLSQRERSRGSGRERTWQRMHGNEDGARKRQGREM